MNKIIFLLLSSIFLASCFDGSYADLNSEEKVSLKYRAIEKKFDNESEKPFALFFYNSDCAICSIQAPILETLYKEKGFRFYAILGDKFDRNEALKYKKGMSFPIMYEKKAREYLGKVVGGIFGVPVIYFYDKNGIFDRRFLGLASAELLNAQINKLNAQ